MAEESTWIGVGVNLKTLRYYEVDRVLPQPVRPAPGYRQYDDSHVGRLTWGLTFVPAPSGWWLCRLQRTHCDGL